MLNKFLYFDEMITPVIIKVIFWIGVALAVISGLGMIVSGIGSRYGGGIQVLIGLLTIVIGPFLVRIWCEIMVVLFEIHKNLVEINRKTNSETHLNC